MIWPTLVWGLFAAVLVHEAGHAAAATAFRLPWKPVLTKRGPGILVGADDIRLSRCQIIMTNAAGPIASLLFAVALWRIVPIVALMSAELGILNLVLPHSDGAHIWKAWRSKPEIVRV